LLRNYIGSPGYTKNSDFFYHIVYWVLQNSKERELVLVELFSILFEQLPGRVDMISNEYKFYRFEDIVNMSIDLSRAAFVSFEKLLIKMTSEHLKVGNIITCSCSFL